MALLPVLLDILNPIFKNMDEIDGTPHSLENCPVQKKFIELEEEHNELQKSIQLSALYGKTLLEENHTLKITIKDLRSLHEV